MSSKFKKSLCVDLGISEAEFDRLVRKAPYSYKTYSVAKKSGGYRTIAQPSREIKYIQSWLINNLFVDLPVHKCATAYKRGSSIKKNANAHRENKYIAKFDFKDFFTSIKESDIKSFLSEIFSGRLTDNEIIEISRVSCISQKASLPLCLSIGAPSSPVLSNSILHEFDNEISYWCSDNNIVYTRYADDLTFSTNEKGKTNTIEDKLKEVMRGLRYPTLRLNRKKTIQISKRHQRKITGIVISNEGKLSIGRDRKREISALIHRYTINSLSEDEISYLQGLLGFAKNIEPIFIVRMNEKYGNAVVANIFKFRKDKE